MLARIMNTNFEGFKLKFVVRIHCIRYNYFMTDRNGFFIVV